MSVSQSSSLVHLHSTPDCQPGWGNLWAPPLHFGRRPPQSNYPPDTVPLPVSRRGVRSPEHQGWYLKVGSTRAEALASQPPTYPEQGVPDSNIKL